MSKKWKCERCGECCKKMSIKAPNVEWESIAYLEAHGCKYINGHIIIPARCAYLTSDNLCAIHKTKFSMCKKFGENECLRNQKP